MKWIKASERLGEFKDSDIPHWKHFTPDFCKVDGIPIERGCFIKDIEQNKIWFSYIYVPGTDFSKEKQEKDFARIEYLDETEYFPEPSSDQIAGMRKDMDMAPEREKGFRDVLELDQHNPQKWAKITNIIAKGLSNEMKAHEIAIDIKQQFFITEVSALASFNQSPSTGEQEKDKMPELAEKQLEFLSLYSIEELQNIVKYWDEILKK